MSAAGRGQPPPTREQLLDAARAVAVEDEDRAGVATYLALVERTPGPPPPPRAAPVREDDVELAACVELAWSVLREADPGTSVQDALAAVAWLRLRPQLPGAWGRLSDAPDGLAAYAPEGSSPAPLAERDAEAREVRDAVAGGRLLRVVNFHNTPARTADRLHAELAWYAERFAPVTADDVHGFLDTGRWPTERPGVVPAFFDGFASAAQVAAPVCEELGLTGWFYPPTAFLDTPAEDQRSFAAHHELGLLAEDLAGTGRLAMTWDELAGIAERHEVCGHTEAHALSAAVRTAADVERQVTEPLRRLERVTGRPAVAWAWLGGTPFDPAAPGDRAVRDAGVRLLCSDAQLERIA
jgi:hypothetical protein